MVAALVMTLDLAAQSGPIEAMLADRLGGRPDAVIVVGTIDGSATNLIMRGSAGHGGDTVFEVGGLSDVFIAVALADMIAKREVDLKDPVGKYLPGMAVPTRAGKSIALDDLVMHRSGLPRVLPGLSRAEAAGYGAYTRERLAEFLAGYELTRDIGSRYERSHLGTALLVAAMTARASTPLETLLNDRVFSPLGLHATRMTNGALRSTPNDLLKFVSAHLQTAGPLTAILDDTRSSRSNVGVRDEGLGLGWRIRQGVRRSTALGAGRQILWSSGAAGGHQAFVALVPAEERGVVVLHNQPLTVDDIGFKVLDNLEEQVTPVDAAALAAFAGEYEVRRGFSIVVRVEGRKLAVRVAAEPESTLTQDSELRFVFDYADARITFIRDATGAPIGLMLHRDRQHIGARRVR